MEPTNNFRNVSQSESNFKANLKRPRDDINHASGMDGQEATKKNKTNSSEKEPLQLKISECANSTFDANEQMAVEANLANREVNMFNMDSETGMDTGLEQSLWDAGSQDNWVLVQQMLELNLKVNIDASKLEGPHAGKTLLWFAASYQQWDLVKMMLKRDPKANVDAAVLKGPDAGITPVWLAAAYWKWDLVKMMLEINPNANMEAAPLEGPFAGKTLLWLAVDNEQWDLVKMMLELNPNANLDAAPLEGFYAGVTPLWLAVASRNWRLVKMMLEINPNANLEAAPLEWPNELPNAGKTLTRLAIESTNLNIVKKILEINPKASVDAAPLKGADAGTTVLWLAAIHHQWDLVKMMLELNPKANVDATPLQGPYAGTTPLWLAANHQQWDLVNKMLKLNPKANLDAAPLQGLMAGKNIFDLIFDNTIIHAELSKLMAYLIVLGVDDTKSVNRVHGAASVEWERLKNSIDLTFGRVAISFYDMWHNAENNVFRQLPPELFEKPCLYVIWSEQPELKSVSESVLLAKLDSHVELMYEANQTKACKNIAVLAFNEFRRENGLWSQTYTKSQINDLHRLIESSLFEFQKDHKDIQYHQKNRERIVIEIGQEQVEYPAKLTKTGIKIAIERALL